MDCELKSQTSLKGRTAIGDDALENARSDSRANVCDFFLSKKGNVVVFSAEEIFDCCKSVCSMVRNICSKACGKCVETTAELYLCE